MSQRNAGTPETVPDQGEVPSGEPERADRRRIALVLLVAAVLAAGSYGLSRMDLGVSRGLATSLVQYTVLTGNVILLFALSFYLLRYLVRLFAARKAGILGSRLQFKLVLTFIGLCLVPALALYVAAIVMLTAAVDRSFAPPVEAMYRDAEEVTVQFQDDATAAISAEVQDLATDLVASGLLVPEREIELHAMLTSEMRIRHLAATRVQISGQTLALRADEPWTGAERRVPAGSETALDLDADLGRARAGERFARIARTASSGGAFYVVAGAPLGGGPAGREAGAIVTARRIPAELVRKVDNLRDAIVEHQRLRAAVPWLKIQQASLFFGFSLLIILAATWVGITIARSITTPIQRLAEGTAEVRKGNLGHVVQWEGRDELAMLVDAFNDMSLDLKVKEDEVTRTTGELRAANEALSRANAELATRREHTERLLRTLTAGVIALDPEGRVIASNPAALQILEIAETPAQGASHEEFLAGEALADLRREFAEALGKSPLRRAREITLPLLRGPVHLQVVLTSQPEAEGEGTGLLAVFEDVTELVRAQKMAAWETVARRIAHEIKNPLTPIQLAAQRILKKFREGSSELASVLESGVETITAEVAGLKAMVDEFSRFARMPEVVPVEGDLNALVQSVAALYEGHEGLKLTLELSPELPPVLFDPEQLRRAVVNLLDNAVEATERKGHIVLSTSVVPGRSVARLSVADDGPGVPAAERERLFLPYFTTRSRGTGLGLAITHRIVADHQGQVRVEDNRPRGARFVVDLPLAGAAVARAAANAERGPR